MPEENILFVKPGCPFSAAAREDLRKRGVAFTDYNVQADPEALRRMLALNGGKHNVPTIVENGQVEVGFGGS